MRSHKNDAELLEETLEKLFEHIEKTINEKIPDETKKSIKDDIKEDLKGELNLSALEDLNVQKKLLGCITAKLMGDEKQYESLTTNLKSPAFKAADPVLDKKLQMDGFVLKTLEQMLAKNNGLSIKDATKKLLENKPKPGETKPDAKQVSELEKQLDACLRNLFGGDNPTISGEINFPVLGPIVGNLCAYTNQSTANANSMALMVEAITYNGGKPDPIGLEQKLKQTDLAEGIVATPSLALTPTLNRH